MRDLFEVKKYEVFELDMSIFNSDGAKSQEKITVGSKGEICGGIGECVAFTVQGAYERLREDIDFIMHGFVDTCENEKVFISQPEKADGYDNVHIVVASIRKASDKDSKFVEEFIIVEGKEPIKI